MSFFGNYSPALLNFDNELQYFYNQLLSTILKKKKLKKMVIESLGQDRIRHLKKTSKKVSLNTTAYIFRYGPCYSSAIANHMLRMVKNNPFLFQHALWKRSVNVCCFGNAAVLEIVSICKIFNLAQDLFWEATRKPLQINVAIIGGKFQWKTAVENLLELLNASDICDATKMAVNVQFLKVNTGKLLDSSMVKVLKEADLVTMVKFVSSIKFAAIREQLVWEIADSMKNDGVLFFLDTGMTPHCKQLKKIFEPMSDLQCTYGPNNIEPYTLRIGSIKKCIELFYSRYQGNICLTSCIVNSCAWLKSGLFTKHIETNTKTSFKLSRREREDKVKKAKQEWCKNILKSQKALEDYHYRVQHIMPAIRFENEEDQYNSPNFFVYSNNQSIMFKSKSKEKRIYIDERCDFSVA